MRNKKLSEQADGDTISRQAAIDFIDTGHLCNPNEPRWSDNEIVNFLKSIPSAQSEQRWIPCSERLPEENMTRTLTTIHTPHKGTNVRSGRFCNGMFFNDNGDCWKATDKEVIAWMPLPEPYQGGDKE